MIQSISMEKVQSPLQVERLKKMSFWQVVKRFFDPVKYAKKYYAIQISLRIYESILLIMSMNMLKYITEYIKNWDERAIIQFAVIYWILVTIYFILYIIFRDYENFIFVIPNYHIFKRNLQKILEIENTYYENIWTGKLIEISKWAMTRSSQVTEILSKWINLTFTIIGSFVVIFFIDWRYSLFLIWSILMVLIAYKLARPKLKEIQKQRKDVRWDVSRFTVKFFMSKNEILTQNKSEKEFKYLFGLLEKEKEIVHSRNNVNIRIFKFPDFLVYSLQICIILIFGIWAIKGTNDIWDFAVFVWLLTVIQKSTFDLLRLVHNVDFESVHIFKMRETFDNAPIMNPQNWSDFTYKIWNIKIQDITFSYDKSPVFQNFNLQIQGWTKTAFVGESWGGKTTLIKLLAGYIRADSWEIEIDGQKLSEIKLTDYYKHIGYLTQDPSVFDGTIYENLVYALDTDPTKEELEKVVKLAKCEFIREFENWLETEIGERWIRLSWWQKQRLAIAKIMLKNPNIILLDEPTSALDSFNEELINIALHNLFKGKTVIVVAHRLQTVKQADRILLIEQWKVLEEWTHDELVQLNGKYKKMLDLQSWF